MLAGSARSARVESVIEGLHLPQRTTVTQARDGGRGRNVVPDRFVLNVNHRFAPDRTLDEAVAGLRARLSSRAPRRVDFTDALARRPARARATRWCRRSSRPASAPSSPSRRGPTWRGSRPSASRR